MSKNLISLCPVVSKMTLTMSAGILLLFFLKNAQLWLHEHQNVPAVFVKLITFSCVV